MAQSIEELFADLGAAEEAYKESGTAITAAFDAEHKTAETYKKKFIAATSGGIIIEGLANGGHLLYLERPAPRIDTRKSIWEQEGEVWKAINPEQAANLVGAEARECSFYLPSRYAQSTNSDISMLNQPQLQMRFKANEQYFRGYPDYLRWRPISVDAPSLEPAE